MYKSLNKRNLYKCIPKKACYAKMWHLIKDCLYYYYCFRQIMHNTNPYCPLLGRNFRARLPKITKSCQARSVTIFDELRGANIL